MDWQQIKNTITWAVLISGIFIALFYAIGFLLQLFDFSSKIFENIISKFFIFFFFAPLVVLPLSLVLFFFEKNPRTKKILLLVFLAVSIFYAGLHFVLLQIVPTPA